MAFFDDPQEPYPLSNGKPKPETTEERLVRLETHAGLHQAALQLLRSLAHTQDEINHELARRIEELENAPYASRPETSE